MKDLGELLSDLTSGDTERAEAAAMGLPEHGEAALAKLSKLVENSNIDTRWWAVRALAGFPQVEAGNLLFARLKDADSSIRYCAALALGQNQRETAIPLLIEILSSNDPLLARLAGDALVAHGVAAVEPLIAALDGLPLAAKVEATRALALIGDPRSISALFKLADSDSPTLEHWVSEGLERMGVGMRFFQAGE
jgi:HEAT repeat protein